MLFSDLENNALCKEYLKDSEIFSKIFDMKKIFYEVELPDEPRLSEYEFYIHRVGFYIASTIQWGKQLEFAIEFLSNFNYQKSNKANRIDHLRYNIENYLIRISSMNDKVLQIINSLFHLCNDERDVKFNLILNNLKVQQNSSVVRSLKDIKKTIDKYDDGRRNIIVHRHSFLEKELKKLEVFYATEDKNWGDKLPSFKQLRSERLKEYIAEKKSEFKAINSDLCEKIDKLFLELLPEYIKNREAIKPSNN